MSDQNSQQEKSKEPKCILCVGEILWDMLPEGAKVGGAPLNVAVHLRKFGFDVKFAGRIGRDKPGDDLSYFLVSSGLGNELLQVDHELPTSTVEVYLEPDNKVRFEIVDNVAWDRIELTEDLRKAAAKADVIVYGTLASRHDVTRATMLDLLKINSGVALIDVNLRSPFDTQKVVETLLTNASVAKLNDDELRVISGWYNINNNNERELTKWFSDKYGCKLVCVTRGANGALVYNNGYFVDHPGYNVNVKDTVGSGDAFLAGFLLKYLEGKTLSESLEFACATGALVATRAGATPEYRTEDILQIIKTQKTT
jgi:fructokinase